MGEQESDKPHGNQTHSGPKRNPPLLYCGMPQIGTVGRSRNINFVSVTQVTYLIPLVSYAYILPSGFAICAAHAFVLIRAARERFLSKPTFECGREHPAQAAQTRY